MAIVSDAVSLHLTLKGLVDPAVEIKKLSAKALKLEDEAGKLRKRMASAGYIEKVPADVRAANAESLAGLEGQLAVIATLIAQYAGWGGGTASAAGGGGGVDELAPGQ